MKKENAKQNIRRNSVDMRNVCVCNAPENLAMGRNVVPTQTATEKKIEMFCQHTQSFCFAENIFSNLTCENKCGRLVGRCDEDASSPLAPVRNNKMCKQRMLIQNTNRLATHSLFAYGLNVLISTKQETTEFRQNYVSRANIRVHQVNLAKPQPLHQSSLPAQPIQRNSVICFAVFFFLSLRDSKWRHIWKWIFCLFGSCVFKTWKCDSWTLSK